MQNNLLGASGFLSRGSVIAGQTGCIESDITVQIDEYARSVHAAERVSSNDGE